MGKRDPVTAAEAAQGRAVGDARALDEYGVWGVEGDWDAELGMVVPSERREAVSFCGRPIRRTGELCTWSAGSGTAHVGVGACVRHDSQVERAAGAWHVAHIIARHAEISPWEALLLAVRRAAAWAAFYEGKMAEAPDDESLGEGGTHRKWVIDAERVNDKLARYSKMAVDAGVAAMLVAQARTEGEQIARVLNAALGAAGLDDEQERRVRAALRTALLELDGEARGETVSGSADSVGYDTGENEPNETE